MLDRAVLVTLIIGVTTVSIATLTLLLNRPIALWWERCWKRHGWLPEDVESQTPSTPNCQGRSNGAEGGSNQGVTDPQASAAGELTPVNGETLGYLGSAECRIYDALAGNLEELVSSERRVWAE